MKKLTIVILLALLLAGCAAGAPVPASQTPAAAAEETQPEIQPETQPQTQPPETEPADPVESLLGTMTLEEKVGQLFLARCPGEGAQELLQDCRLGGFVLFGQDFDGQTPASLRETIQTYQSASRIPLLIAVDEEGGTVCRVSSHPEFRSEPYRSPRALYARGGMAEVLDTETEKAAQMWDLGINTLLGPVCDVSRDWGAFMYQRSLGESPEVTGEFAAGTVERYASFGVGSVLKHFPGYGSNADTHTGIAVDSRSLETLESADLIPFASGIRAGCGGILVSHTLVQAMDSEMPASLSPAVHTYLRETMGFDGVILTDDLDMGAITERYGTEEAAVLAVLAGNSLICTGSAAQQYAAVLDAVNTGRIPLNQLDTAVRTVLQWKQALGLL